MARKGRVVFYIDESGCAHVPAAYSRYFVKGDAEVGFRDGFWSGAACPNAAFTCPQQGSYVSVGAVGKALGTVGRYIKDGMDALRGGIKDMKSRAAYAKDDEERAR